MDERQRLRQTSRRFGSEVERVVDGNFIDMPAPLVRLVDALDSEPVISAYVTDCVERHLPEGFDERAEADRVTDGPDATFGPFADDHRAATAQRYLIVSELARRGTKYHSPVFHGYGRGSERLQDMAHSFMDEVVVELISDVNAHLAAMARELGLESLTEAPEPETAQDGTGTPEVEASPERLAALLREVESSAEALGADEREDALLQLEALTDELASEEPKRSVVRVLLRALGMMAADARFSVAVEQLQTYLEATGVL